MSTTRRDFLKRSTAYAALTAAGARRSPGAGNGNPDYIIVGSGPGGGPLAANLAAAGYSVALLEAGPDGNDVAQMMAVPLFFPLISAQPSVAWNYFVRHYTDQTQQALDSKYVPAKTGIYYPRASTIGGCSVHNVLVMMYPNNSDWDGIAQLTGDDSWGADNMRYYFQRLEACRYVVRPPDVFVDPSRHGYYGWQPIEITDPTIYTNDPQLSAIIKQFCNSLGRPEAYDAYLHGALDPNSWQVVDNESEGLYTFPMSRMNGVRVGVRERVLAAAAAYPNLNIMTNSLATRVLFDGNKAVGVEYMQGNYLYSASPNATPGASAPAKKQLMANREVIVACGTFNSPQLLMLSGIGPSSQLSKMGIPVVSDLAGVGQNMQDRYEASVTGQLAAPITVVLSCTPGQPNDPCLAMWLQGKGPYTINESVMTALIKSDPAITVRDLMISLAAGPFHGYYPGWQGPVISTPDQFAWLLLKAHTINRSGTVQLNSPDPRDMPLINFHYFQEGNDTANQDLNALVQGMQICRNINAKLGSIFKGEVLPGSKYQTASDLATWIKNEAWGHHASCTNKMGTPDDPMAVVDSDFKVFGTQNLRVVDASIFPRIPGYYVMIPIMMVSEKASDVILAAASRS